MKKFKNWINEGGTILYISKKQFYVKIILQFIITIFGFYLWICASSLSDQFLEIYFIILGFMLISKAGTLTDFNFTYKQYLKDRKFEIEEEKKVLKKILNL